MAAVEDTPPAEFTADDLADLSGLQSKQPPKSARGGGDNANDTDNPSGGRTPPRARPQGSGAGGRTTAADKMEAKLVEFFSTVGIVTAAFNETDGLIIVENAQSLAANWTALAQENRAVKRAIESILETGAWSGAIMASAAVLIPIMDNHGYIPSRFRIIVPTSAGADSGAGDVG